MKQIALLLITTLLIFGCKKTTPKIDTSVALSERILGHWNITDVEFSGVVPNQSTGQSIPFSGTGKNVSGEFNFQKNPNIGEFQVSFLAEIDLGLPQPLALTFDEGHSGNWTTIENDQYVRMWSGNDTIYDPGTDTLYDWKVLTNLENEQKWLASFKFEFGFPYDSIPVDIIATIKR